MAQVETFTGTITRTTTVARFEITRNPEGGKVRFFLLQTLAQDGVAIGAANATPYEADFADLPATFPVEIGGNIVDVAGQTILDALDAVAQAVVAAS